MAASLTSSLQLLQLARQPVDIKQLKYFIAIAEEGSLSAASARLHVAQPALSHHVIKVERELGVNLIKGPREASRSPSLGKYC